MNASLFQIHKNFWRSLICLGLFICVAHGAHNMSAYADDRMAGKAPNKPSTHTKNLHWKRDFPAASKAQNLHAETLGVFTTVHEGGLGNDLWYGSRRKHVVELLRELPTHTNFRTINELTTRLLLTSADTSVLNSFNQRHPAENLLLIRLEKLMARGHYDHVAQIYKELPILPPFPELAETGLIALLMNNESAIACLETNALKDFSPEKHVTFWQHMERICANILENKYREAVQTSIETISKDRDTEPSAPYPVLETLLSGEVKTYKPLTEKDIISLSMLEIAFLNAAGKWDLSIVAKAPENLTSPLALSLIAKNQNLKPETRFRHLLRAVQLGYSLTEDIAAFYNVQDIDESLFETSTSTEQFLDRTAKMSSLEQLAASYKRLVSAIDEDKTERILSRAFSLEKDSNALIPFANFMYREGNASLSDKHIRTLLNISLQSQTPLVRGGLEQAIKLLKQSITDTTSKSESAKTYAQIAALLNQNMSEFHSLSPEILPDFGALAAFIPAELLVTTKKYYEKLDSGTNIAQYAARDSYENPSGLTTETNYVMPSVDLLNRLTLVNKKKLTGEAILLSCLVLNETHANTLDMNVFRRITDSLVNVGLTENAQRFTVEVILSREYE